VGTNKQLQILLDPASRSSMYYPRPRFTPDSTEDGFIDQYTRARADRERATRGRSAHNQTRVDEFLASFDSGNRLRQAKAAFGASAGPMSTVGTTEQLKLAADSIASGLSFAVSTRDSSGGGTSYDTHFDNSPQPGYQELLFGQLKTLADDLANRPGQSAGTKLLDHTVVVVLSEMGRTPKLNERKGKDHWPFATLVVFGSGVAGGRTLGGTDDRMLGRPVNLETGALDDGGTHLLADHVVAGLLELLGVEAKAYLPSIEPLRGFIA
jgi:hypothetical protein